MWFFPRFSCHKLVTICIISKYITWNNRAMIFFFLNESWHIIWDIHEWWNHEIMFNSTEEGVAWEASPSSEFLKLHRFSDILIKKKCFFKEKCKTKVICKRLVIVSFYINLLTYCQCSKYPKSMKKHEYCKREISCKTTAKSCNHYVTSTKIVNIYTISFDQCLFHPNYLKYMYFLAYGKKPDLHK